MSRAWKRYGQEVAAEQKVTFCRICEPLCGMVATVEDGRVVKLRPDPDHPVGAAVIGVADDGSGFDLDTAKSAGRGLSGMRKRAEQLGANLRVERQNGGGTTVSLRFPPPSGLRPKAGAAA